MTTFIFIVGASLLVYQFFTLLNLREKIKKLESIIQQWQKGLRDGTIVEKPPRRKRSYDEGKFTMPDPLKKERLNAITGKPTKPDLPTTNIEHVNWDDGIIEDDPKQKPTGTYALRDALGLSDFEPITQQHIADIQGKKINPKLLQPDLDHSPTNSPFYNKKVVLTGDLSMDRKQVAEILFKLGADLNTSVSKKTNFLVVGQNPGWAKMEKAQSLIRDGVELQILYETDLWSVIDDFKLK